MPRTYTTMKEFELFEISAVDIPAQDGAKAHIMKRGGLSKKPREFSPETRERLADEGEAMPDGSFPIPDKGALRRAIQSIGRASNPAAARRHIIRRARALGATDMLPEDWNVSNKNLTKSLLDTWATTASFEEIAKDFDEAPAEAVSALEESLKSISDDPKLARTAKARKMRESVDDFLSTVRKEFPSVEEAIAKYFEGDDEMKTQKELEAQVEELTAKLKKATDDAEKAAADHTTKASEAAAALTKATEDLKAAQAELASLKAKADMEEDEEEMMDEMDDEEEKKKFLAMDHPARKAYIAKVKSGDETVTIEGQTISKRKVGPEMFAILKAQSERITKAETDAAAEKAKREDAEYTKRAADELGHLPGDLAVKAKVLKGIAGMGKAEQDALTAMLKAGDKAISAGFERIGVRNGGAPTDATKAFEKRISEVKAANPKMSALQAMTKARQDFPDEFKAYREAEGHSDSAAN